MYFRRENLLFDSWKIHLFDGKVGLRRTDRVSSMCSMSNWGLLKNEEMFDEKMSLSWKILKRKRFLLMEKKPDVWEKSPRWLLLSFKLINLAKFYYYLKLWITNNNNFYIFFKGIYKYIYITINRKFNFSSNAIPFIHGYLCNVKVYAMKKNTSDLETAIYSSPRYTTFF